MAEVLGDGNLGQEVSVLLPPLDHPIKHEMLVVIPMDGPGFHRRLCLRTHGVWGHACIHVFGKGGVHGWVQVRAVQPPRSQARPNSPFQGISKLLYIPHPVSHLEEVIG